MASSIALSTKLASLKAHLTVMSDKCLYVSSQRRFAVVFMIPSWPLVNRITQHCLSHALRCLRCYPFWFSILPSILRCTTQDSFMPIEATTFLVEFLLLNCTNAWYFYTSNDGGIWLQLIQFSSLYNLLVHNYTIHINLHNNEHINVEARGVVVNKTEYLIPNHFTVHNFVNPFSFLFYFLIWHLWTILHCLIFNDFISLFMMKSASASHYLPKLDFFEGYPINFFNAILMEV